MKLANIIKNVIFFKVDPSGIVYYKNQEGELFKMFNNETTLLDTEVFDDFHLQNEVLTYNKDSYTELKINNLESKSNEHFYIINNEQDYSGLSFLVDKNNHNQLYLKELNQQQPAQLLNDNYSWDFINYDFPEYFLHKRDADTHLKKYNSTKLIWELDLKNIDIVPNVQIKKLICINDADLIFAGSQKTIIQVDKLTGKIKYQWQLSPKTISLPKNQIINTDKMDKELNSDHIFYLALRHYCRIDLQTKSIDLLDISKELNTHHISDLRNSLYYRQDEKYIYTIGNMDKSFFKLDYTPQCLFAFNKSTKTIDWVHRFEDDVIHTHHPIRRNNKLYQLSGLKNLYIFEDQV